MTPSVFLQTPSSASATFLPAAGAHPFTISVHSPNRITTATILLPLSFSLSRQLSPPNATSSSGYRNPARKNPP
ncbi:unnamed protein product [Cuscuta europaea]|uniref:Uncharacterized protein n=1 Tax=Cuscuta europaea TaxID=41803 RepID=A0A9P0ZJB0_CUSEU|nr:unnamed protein product [Cuscuta europaea]